MKALFNGEEYVVVILLKDFGNAKNLNPEAEAKFVKLKAY